MEGQRQPGVEHRALPGHAAASQVDARRLFFPSRKAKTMEIRNVSVVFCESKLVGPLGDFQGTGFQNCRFQKSERPIESPEW